MRRVLLAVLLLASPVLAGCLGGEEAPAAVAPSSGDDAAPAFEPHVIVAVPDSGINPYHVSYYRPDRTEHPCTYVRDFPCDLPALNLTVGGDDYEAALEADKAVWEAMEPGAWYWIPRTAFVAVSCEAPEEGAAKDDVCLLDDTGMHGTGTTSSVLSENPDALIAFKEGGPEHDAFAEAGIPVDVFSVSWGHIVPIPAKEVPGFGSLTYSAPLYVVAAGNDPRSTVLDSWAGDVNNIVVGGAYAEGRGEEPFAAKQPDVVSYYCRPTAQTKSVDETRESYCGTSFAAPTVAGALSKVILGLRRASGHDGSIEGNLVDPVLGITVEALRDAMNATASYDPEAAYPNTDPLAVPANPAAPWLQWGWGFYDGRVADATLAVLLGEAPTPTKPSEAIAYMRAVHDAKRALYG